jgi:hypothetical protein
MFIPNSICWPERKSFAFTIVDDTDCSTVENTKPVYDLLADNGLLTTKTVWPLSATGKPITSGDTLENPKYRAWVLELATQGFEIAMHGVSDGSSDRQRIIEGLHRYRELLGDNPILNTIHVNHTGQKEALYWGAGRLDPPVRWLYARYRQHCGSQASSWGIDQLSPHFWGDLCQQHIKYVRNLVFANINTIKMDPLMPYHDARRPYVRYWFSSSYGSGVDSFCKLIRDANQDRLVEEGGGCIVYTHLGSTFYPLRDDFKRLIRRLGRLPGWFVPASTLLDFLGATRGWCNVENYEQTLRSMQWQWLVQQLQRKGASARVSTNLQQLLLCGSSLVRSLVHRLSPQLSAHSPAPDFPMPHTHQSSMRIGNR